MATTLRFLFYCVLLNCAALAVLYPEQLLWRNTRFMFVHDTEYLLENVFAPPAMTASASGTKPCLLVANDLALSRKTIACYDASNAFASEIGTYYRPLSSGSEATMAQTFDAHWVGLWGR